MEGNTIESLETMKTFAKDFLETLEAETHATVLALKGDLGSGKTTFTQSLAEALGVTDHVTSPTFVIQKIYPLSQQKFTQLVHIDAYRMDSAHELAVLGFTKLLEEPNTLICIEWPERVAELIPKNATTLEFAFVNDTTRSVKMSH